MRFTIVALASLFVLSPASGSEEGARTLSPYFHVSGDGEAERLPLEETRADVAVAGPIARVTVRQVFRNRGREPIEAIYVFPASTRAAVHGLRMRIGERTIEARIARRGEARRDYEGARDAGQRAALLEEQRPNVFTMNVANVMPGERIAVELEYSELVVPEAGVYELVYPAVVGPRYGGGADPSRDGWIVSPYLHEGEPEPWKFAFRARVEGAVPLKDLASPSHDIDVRFASANAADVTLREPGGGNRDVVLRWRLAGEAVQAGVMVLPAPRDADAGYFLVAVEPPARPPSGAEALAREYVFVVDVSGSMHGFPLDTAKALMRDLLGSLGAQDLVNVVLFAGSSQVLAPAGSLPASAANVQRAVALVDSQRGGGGTEILGALRAAYAIPRPDRAVARTVVVVTDGYVAVEAEAYRFVRERLGEASLFSFGIGAAVNRHLVEGLARAGQGEPFVVLGPERARDAARRFRDYVERPVLTGIQVSFEGLQAREVLPARVPDLFAQRPIVLVGQYRGAPRGRVVLTGQSGSGPWKAVVDVSADDARGEHGPLRILWARRWVEMLQDELSLAPATELEDAIADLGLSHRLLTRFTSFVAVDSEVAHRGGKPVEVQQPLPLPRGVSDLAVGSRAAALAPPGGGTMQRLNGTLVDAPELSSGAGSPGSAEARPEAARDSAKQAGERRDAGAPVLRVAVASARGLEPAALTRAVTARLRSLRVAAGATARLRLTLDAAGRVARVEVLAASSPRLRRELELQLSRLETGLSGAGSAELTLTAEPGVR
jgi:Ca-activated chloride channel family protein